MKLRTALLRAGIVSATGAVIETARRRITQTIENQRRRQARKTFFKRTGVALGALVAAFAVRAAVR